MALSEVLDAVKRFIVILAIGFLFFLFSLSPALLYMDMEAALEVTKLVFLFSWALSCFLTAMSGMDDQYTSAIEKCKKGCRG